MSSDRRTEPPSPRRLRRARQRGDHPVSRALIGACALAAALVVLPHAVEALSRHSTELLLSALRQGPPPAVHELAWRVTALAAPPLAAAALAALAVGLWQTQGVLSAQPLSWDFRRLSPFGRTRDGGLARGLSIALGLAAALAIAATAWRLALAVAGSLPDTVGDGATAQRLVAEAATRLAGSALAVLLVLGVVDSVHQHARWRARHRMTREEARQEQRLHEGDPEMHGFRRRAHRELLDLGATRDLGGAALLVVDSHRLAVALAHDATAGAAPRVLLRGHGAHAGTLEALGASLGVPIWHDPALAHALARVPVEREIPAPLFAEVARALSRSGHGRGRATS